MIVSRVYSACPDTPALPPARHRSRPNNPLPTHSEPLPPARPRARPQQSSLHVVGCLPCARTPRQIIDLIASGTLDPHTVSLEEEIALARWAKEARMRAQASVARLVAQGHSCRARRARWKMMNKLSVRLDALMVAARRRQRLPGGQSREVREAARVERLTAVLTALPAIADFSQPARAQGFLRPKRTGGFRKLVRFEWEDDAKLRILKSALHPFADLHDGQFMLARDERRRGPASVREYLLQALREAEGDHVFLQFDIRDFFGSITHAWLEDHLGLDQGIVRRFVHSGEMLIVPTGEMRGDRLRDDASRENGRSGVGIPQGSALSSLIAEMVMADILRSDAVFDRVRLFTWSDNLGVLVPRSEAFAVEELIRTAFRRHGAGPFQLSVSRSPITSEFKFLGVWYQVSGGQPVAFVPVPVALAWEASICADMLTAGTDDLLRRWRRVQGKAQAWSWWSGMEPLKRSIEERLSSAWMALQPVPLQAA